MRKFVKIAGIDKEERLLQGSTPLVYAAALGRAEAVEVLLQAGANPNLTNENGQSALMKAVYYNRIDIARSMIKVKADLNSKDKEGHTALTIGSARSASVELLQELIRSGADVNSTTKYGQSALLLQKRGLPEHGDGE